MHVLMWFNKVPIILLSEETGEVLTENLLEIMEKEKLTDYKQLMIFIKDLRKEADATPDDFRYLDIADYFKNNDAELAKFIELLGISLKSINNPCVLREVGTILALQTIIEDYLNQKI